MPIDTIQTNPLALGVDADEIVLTSEDFDFVGWPKVEKIFNNDLRPVRIIKSSPSLEVYHNAIYTPTTILYTPYDGVLFDCEGNKIPASVIKRQRTDIIADVEPPAFEGNTNDLPVYDRPVLYIGRILEHYGHFLLESLASWWPIVNESQEIDRYLVHVFDKYLLELPFVKAFLNAAGINEKNLVFFDTPTKLKEVWVPTTSHQIDSHLYTAYKTLMNHLSVRLGASDLEMTDQPVYISRRNIKLGVIGYRREDELEAFLQGRGVKIVHPENLSIADQVKLFNRHSVIIGITGSGMHNTVLALQPKIHVWLSPPWHNYSAYLTDKCWGVKASHINAMKGTKVDWVKRVVNNKVWKLFTGHTRRTDNFLAWETLDIDRIIPWFLQSGLV